MGPEKIHHTMEESLTQGVFQANYILSRIEHLHEKLTGAGRLNSIKSDKGPPIYFREKPEITVETLNKVDQILNQIFTIMFSDDQMIGKSEDQPIKGYR